MKASSHCWRPTNVIRHKEWVIWPSHLWWALRVAGWLCTLPIRLRRYPLPALVQFLTPGPGRRPRGSSLEMEHLVRLVVWLCQRRCCRTQFFPRACLRQALALSYVLPRLGYPVTIHFGVTKAGTVLHGHCWVVVEGQPVAAHMPLDRFRRIYAYPITPALPPGQAGGAGGVRYG